MNVFEKNALLNQIDASTQAQAEGVELKVVYYVQAKSSGLVYRRYKTVGSIAEAKEFIATLPRVCSPRIIEIQTMKAKCRDREIFEQWLEGRRAGRDWYRDWLRKNGGAQ